MPKYPKIENSCSQMSTDVPKRTIQKKTAPYKDTVDVRTSRVNRLRRLPCRIQRTSNPDQAGRHNGEQASKQSEQIFDSASTSENGFINKTDHKQMTDSNVSGALGLDQNSSLSQNNLSQNVSLSFPLELLSGTAFNYSQSNVNSVAGHQSICLQNQDAASQTVPQLCAANADTSEALNIISSSTEESGIEISESSFITADSQNAHLINQIVHSDLIIDATSLTKDILNPSGIRIVNGNNSSSNREISPCISEMSRAKEIIDLDDSQETFVANENLKPEPECGSEQPEQARHRNLPSPEFDLNKAHISSGNYEGKNGICCNKDVAVVKLLKETHTQTEESASNDSDIICETQYRVPGKVRNQAASNRIQRIHSSYRKHRIQSNSFLSYKYSGSCPFSMKPANQKAVDNKPNTLDADLIRKQEGKVQTNMIQKELGELICEKIDKVQNDKMKARKVYLNNCTEALVTNNLTRKFLEKFGVNIFEEPAQSVIDIDYNPTFHNLHFARSTNAELYEIMSSSISTTDVIDETLTKVVTEHCERSHNKQNFDSDSENEESSANRSWLKAYINETKCQRKDLMEKVKMERRDGEIGNNLREWFNFQGDSSKDDELQELLIKLYDCTLLPQLPEKFG
uniref:Uncharacterized protein n=1 Tax=Dendroctonus ponderosae TaxID=77166 RepID=A0AAR5Q8H1_DENPD